MALRVLSDLFERGVLHGSDDKALVEIKQRLLNRLIAQVKRYVTRLSTSAGTMTSATTAATGTTTTTVSMTTADGGSGSSASAGPGRSSAESKQISAVIDALSIACVAGVDTGSHHFIDHHLTPSIIAPHYRSSIIDLRSSTNPSDPFVLFSLH